MAAKDLIWLGIGPSTSYPQRFLTFGLRAKRLADYGVIATASVVASTAAMKEFKQVTTATASVGRSTIATGDL